MKTLLLFCTLITTTSSFSQLTFPALSPKGEIEQKTGFTDITIDYERPAARGRKVFGELVPYDKLWRTGAGNCTKIRFSKSVKISNQRIDKGTYSIFSIPKTTEWTIIFNRDTTLYGTASYDKTKNVFQFNVKNQLTNRYYESLTIDIDVIPNNARIYLSWENTQVSFDVMTETDKIVTDFIKSYLLTSKSKDSEEYAMAADYYFYLNKSDDALHLINQAITIRNDSWYYRLKIDILEKLGKYKEAITVAQQVITVDQNRTAWDQKTKQESVQEYKNRIEILKSKLIN